MKASEAKAKPRFVFVLNWPVTPGTGVTAVILGLANAMKDRYQPEYLVIGWSEPPPGQAWVPVPIPGGGVRNALAYLLTLLPRLYRLHSVVRGAAVVNVHYPGLQALPLALLRRLGLGPKLILSVHGAEVATALEASGLERRVYQWLFSSADLIVACSSSLASKIGSLGGRSRIVSIWNGAYAARSDDATDDAKVDIGCPYIVNVAAFVPKKAHDVLLNAFALIRARWPTLKLVIIGNKGPARAEIERRMGAPDLRGSVVLLSDVTHEEVLRWLRQGACFVLSSRDEPFGIAVLEAGLARVPVVATAVGGIPEYAKTGVHAILCRPDDPRELAAGVLDVLSDPISAARRVDAFYTVARSLTWDRCWSLYAREAAL